MCHPTYRPATAADIDAIVDFSCRLNQEDPDFTGEFHFDEAGVRDALHQLLANPALGRVWLICADDSPIGFVALCFGFSLESHGLDAVIDEIYLAADYRGRGIGTAAMQFVEAEARRLGVKRLYLEVERANQRAVAVYHNLGFEDLGRFLMNKRLV